MLRILSLLFEICQEMLPVAFFQKDGPVLFDFLVFRQLIYKVLLVILVETFLVVRLEINNELCFLEPFLEMFVYILHILNHVSIKFYVVVDVVQFAKLIYLVHTDSKLG